MAAKSRTPEFVMPGLVPGIHVFLSTAAASKTWMAGHRRAEATPSSDGYGRHDKSGDRTYRGPKETNTMSGTMSGGILLRPQGEVS